MVIPACENESLQFMLKILPLTVYCMQKYFAALHIKMSSR